MNSPPQFDQLQGFATDWRRLLARGTTMLFLGLLIWQQWPAAGAWFMAFGLSADIACRGWAILMFALWLRQTHLTESAA